VRKTATTRLFARPVPFVLMPLVRLLAFWTGIPVMIAGWPVVQIPAGLLPEDSLRLALAPAPHFPDNPLHG